MVTWKTGLLALLATSQVAFANTKRYLVEFKNPDAFQTVVQGMQPRAMAFGVQSSAVRLFNANASVTQALEHLQMVVVESADERAIEQLRQHPAISLVEEEIFHPAPRPLATWNTASLADTNGTKKNAKVETPWGILTVKAPEAWKVSKGESARVMVLDTGIDKDHPALTSRLEKAKNFTGGSESNYGDEIGHGTHVAGTILADGRQGGLVGVAPRARLLMGKVCGSVGCSSVAIANGINWAVQEKVDVVNMSLGGVMISEGEARAIRRAEDAGVFIAAASGNDGTSRVSFPAAVATITAVGAIDINQKKADFSQWGPELDVVAPGVDVLSAVPRGTGRGATVMVDVNGKGLDVVRALPFVGSPLRNLENDLVFAGLGKPADIDSAKVAGKIALISRGEIPFKEKVMNALQKGAVGVLIFNNSPGLIQGSLTDDGSEAQIPAAMIEQTLGETIKSALMSGRVVKASLAIEASDFAAFQGTSMATPHVAGVAALIRSTNRGLTPAQVRELLKSTATPLGPNDQNQYGAGLVNAAAAVAQARANLQLAFQIAN